MWIEIEFGVLISKFHALLGCIYLFSCFITLCSVRGSEGVAESAHLGLSALFMKDLSKQSQLMGVSGSVC